MTTEKLFTKAQREALDRLATSIAEARGALADVRVLFSKEILANEQAYDAERELFSRLHLLSDDRNAAASSGVVCDLYEGLLKQVKVTRAFGQAEEAE
jgi:hypothetical protein